MAKSALQKAILVGIIIAAVLAFLTPAFMLLSGLFAPNSTGQLVLWSVGMFCSYLLGLTGIFFLVLACIALASNQKLLYSSVTTTNRLESLLEKQSETFRMLINLSQLSDKVKSLIYREQEVEALYESFNSFLFHQDYQSAENLVKQMEVGLGLVDEAARMREEIEQNRRATIDDKLATAIEKIRDIIDKYDWPRAKREAARLGKLFPDNPKIAALPQDIVKAFNVRKRDLLKEYEKAVKVNDVEKGIDLLKELDRYLTPEEGAALTESARDVFKKKLHNLGVQFAIAIADQQWQVAVKTGEQIAQEYPNSRMAREVREKMDLLKQYAAAADVSV
ncbi:MAG TPA: hypothetical protein PKK48_07760 [Phycisphaerae bacterium]|nr:hypothetical protein [Phycisphaerae bacterium]HPS53599.1 hypothetical protein [Phycisphaerae bacterium]